MRVRFWGTRGSMPVALTWRDMRDKLAQALVAAHGRALGHHREGAWPSSRASSTSRSRTPSAAIPPASSSSRRAPRPTSTSSATWAAARAPSACTCSRARRGAPATINIFMSHVHWDHIMGFPFFGPAYVPRHDDPHPRLPRHARAGLPPAAGRRPASPWPSAQLAASIEFVPLEPDKTQDVSGVQGHAPAAAALRRLLRLSLRAGGKQLRLHAPTPSTSSRTAPRPTSFVAFFRERRRGDLRRDVLARRGDLA